MGRRRGHPEQFEREAESLRGQLEHGVPQRLEEASAEGDRVLSVSHANGRL